MRYPTQNTYLVAAVWLTAMALLSSIVDARRLTDKEMAAISGAGVGYCDTGSGAFNVGWTCNTVGTFACSNTCDKCSSLGTKATCLGGGGSCWNCAGAASITECSSLPGPDCTDMGNTKLGSPCGGVQASGCGWSGTSCSCGALTLTGTGCLRFNCL